MMLLELYMLLKQHHWSTLLVMLYMTICCCPHCKTNDVANSSALGLLMLPMVLLDSLWNF